MLRPRVSAHHTLLNLFLALTVTACSKVVTVQRTTVPATSRATLDKRSPWLKAHLRSGGVYILAQWRSDSEANAIIGTGEHQNANRVVIDSGLFRVPLDSVSLFETNVVQRSGAHEAMTVVSGITMVVAAVCLANPKACFGSCPTFYVSDGAGTPLMAEGFSASVAPALEATDLDALWLAAPASRDLTVRMTNEAFETHVVRWVDLIAVPRAPGVRVVADDHGAFFAATALTPPRACAAPDGDCLPAIRQFDGVMHSSSADSNDLAVRESIDLEFAAPPPGELGVIISTRQSLLSTYLFYQALAWMGSNATPWLGRLSRNGTTPAAGGIGALLGRLEVLVQDSMGVWIRAGAVGETGPLATDTKVVPLPRAVKHGAAVRVRLRGTKGLWRVEQAVLATIKPAAPAIRLSPVRVTTDGHPDPAARTALLDSARVLTTFRGDRYDLHYRLPGKPAGYELFLEARGYYLEWMRQEWLAEENPLKAAQLLFDPAAALKALAPAYKRQEAGMDSLFWGSRYVRP